MHLETPKYLNYVKCLTVAHLKDIFNLRSITNINKCLVSDFIHFKFTAFQDLILAFLYKRESFRSDIMRLPFINRTVLLSTGTGF